MTKKLDTDTSPEPKPDAVPRNDSSQEAFEPADDPRQADNSLSAEVPDEAWECADPECFGIDAHTKHCPRCGKMAEYPDCGHCGYDFTTTEGAEDSPTPEEPKPQTPPSSTRGLTDEDLDEVADNPLAGNLDTDPVAATSPSCPDSGTLQTNGSTAIAEASGDAKEPGDFSLGAEILATAIDPVAEALARLRLRPTSRDGGGPG